MFLAVELTWAGPVVIDGTDSNDHGSFTNGANQGGWVYMQKVLDKLASQLDPSVIKVVVDLGTTPSTQARDAITSAFTQSTLPGNGWTLTHIEGAAAIDAWLKGLSTANTGILYIPTVGNTSGDLADSELAIVNEHSTDINDFVGGKGTALLGGGLFSMSESPVTTGVQSYGWLLDLLPAIAVTDLGAGGVLSSNGVALTPDGEVAFPGLTSADLSTGPWHNFFSGDFGGLLVLATAPDDAGVTRDLIIGGGAGATFQQSNVCATRNARFWFTHAFTPELFSDPTSATLLNALKANGGGISLGFLRLPAFFENGDGTKDVNDALMEAMGLYWKSSSRTGEGGGSQNAKQPGSSLCKQRKLLAVELIAATANVRLMRTQPGKCTYSNGGTITNFPANLLQQARTALSGDDPTVVVSMRALLKTFNSAGVANDFPTGGVFEVSTTSTKTNKSIARDPTRQDTCPGVNDTCTNAQAVFFPPNAANPFANAVFSTSVNLSKFHDDFQAPSCGIGGRDAVWKVKPNLGVSGRQFTASTDSSNFDTMLSVWRGDCASNNLTQVTCTNAVIGVRGERLTFTSDGTSTFFIVGEGAAGQSGKLKLKITSP
jgi:hypothetical protein